MELIANLKERPKTHPPNSFFYLQKRETKYVLCHVRLLYMRYMPHTIIDTANESVTCADKEMVSLGSRQPQGLTEAASLL